jgi:hypothetical protein
MTYITRSDVEAFTGFSYTDFKVGGQVMTEGQWVEHLNFVLPLIDQMLNRYCNVTSFDPTTSIVELHDGRGANNDEFGTSSVGLVYYGINGTTYNVSDYTFYLREPFYSMTSVEEDTGSKTALQSWQTRTQRTSTVIGDYEVVTKNEVTWIEFNQNIPSAGRNNVRITYMAGYGKTTAQYKEIQLQALRMASNYLLLKKKVQEVTTIRASGIRDFAQMFDIMNESVILTEAIKMVLDKYKRFNIEGDIFL